MYVYTHLLCVPVYNVIGPGKKVATFLEPITFVAIAST